MGASKSARSGISTPKLSRTRETMRVARSEWPPSSKKSAWTPTRSAPSTSAQIPASTSSVGVEGATYASADDPSGAGSARRSTLPLGVRGSVSSSTKAEGTMYSGTCSRRCARSSSEAGASAPSSPVT